jgi:hypothetical protein
MMTRYCNADDNNDVYYYGDDVHDDDVVQCDVCVHNNGDAF